MGNYFDKNCHQKYKILNEWKKMFLLPRVNNLSIGWLSEIWKKMIKPLQDCHIDNSFSFISIYRCYHHQQRKVKNDWFIDRSIDWFWKCLINVITKRKKLIIFWLSIFFFFFENKCTLCHMTKRYILIFNLDDRSIKIDFFD